jgi:outer membrane receptor for monomeric catechols
MAKDALLRLADQHATALLQRLGGRATNRRHSLLEVPQDIAVVKHNVIEDQQDLILAGAARNVSGTINYSGSLEAAHECDRPRVLARSSWQLSKAHTHVIVWAETL